MNKRLDGTLRRGQRGASSWIKMKALLPDAAAARHICVRNRRRLLRQGRRAKWGIGSLLVSSVYDKSYRHASPPVTGWQWPRRRLAGLYKRLSADVMVHPRPTSCLYVAGITTRRFVPRYVVELQATWSAARGYARHRRRDRGRSRLAPPYASLVSSKGAPNTRTRRGTLPPSKK